MIKQTLQTISNFAQRTFEGVEGAYTPTEDLESSISSLSTDAVIWGSVALIVLMVVSALVRDRFPKLKTPLFAATVVNVLVVTLTLIVSTIYLNVQADSGGPVHWHADIEVWACDQEVEYRNPTGFLSNKVGSPSYHEHDDKRIHLEGVVVEGPDASIGKFFYVTGGVITDSAMYVPISELEEDQAEIEAYFEPEEDTDGVIDLSVREELIRQYAETDTRGDTVFAFRDGQTCPDGTPADVQMFAYEVEEDENGNPVTINDNGTEKTVYNQRKISDPSRYVITDDSNVPPGDCLIFEFAPTKPFTDKKCLQFEVQDEELGQYYYGGVVTDDRRVLPSFSRDAIEGIDQESN